MLAVSAESEPIFEHVTQLLVADTLQADAATKCEELQELSQLLIKFGMAAIFPNLPNLLER